MNSRIAIFVWSLSLAACASLPAPVTVISTSETAASARRGETPGSPAIWVGRGSPEPGLVGSGFVASTSRADGLILRDLQGSVLQRVTGAHLADLDVAAMPLEEGYSVILGGPERISGRTRLVLFRLDRGSDQTVRRWAEIATDLVEPAGFCMRQSRGVVHAVAIDRRGEARQFTVAEGPAGEPSLKESRRFRISQSGQGCAIEPGDRYVYFSHAREGFWRYRLDPSANAEPTWLRASAPHALPRSTGVSFLTDRDGRYLTTLDQDRVAFSVWRLGSRDVTWLGHFEVREQPDGRAVRTVAGMDAYGADLGPFPNGIVVVQDQANADSPNLKYIDWAAVRRALRF